MSSGDFPQSLARGAACVQCRQRKIKCDGQRPACGQCNRANRQNQCEYRETRAPSNARALQQHIARLETRIEELSAHHNSVRLQNPYDPAAGSQPTSQASGMVPTNIAQTLVHLFLPHSSEFGFFLHVPRLIDAFRTDSGVSAANPVTLLRSVICLLGIRLSQNPVYAAEETNLLTGILQHLHSALSAAGDNRRATLYVLQAEILLSYYFFDNNRLLEGRLHTQAAVSVAMICRLHKGAGAAASADTILAADGAWLPPPADIVEYKERVNGWWQTFVLDKSWAVALASPSMIEDRRSLEATIDTPWPLADGDDNLGRGLFNERTVQRFFENVLLDTNTSSLGLHAQAAALYETAHALVSHQHRDPPQYDVAVAALGTSIECFTQVLPPAPSGPAPPADPRAHVALVLSHTLVHCAALQLYSGVAGQGPGSLPRCFTAAGTVARLAQHVDVASIKCVNPIMAMLWASAADALVQCLHSVRSLDRAGGGPSSSSMPSEQAIIGALNALMGSMAAFGQVSPLFSDQLIKLQSVLNAL